MALKQYPQKIVIINTGSANISSVRFAIERLGYQVKVSACAEQILTADKLFLPGVGTAQEAMKNLESMNLASILPQIKQPTLGICLGMQLFGVSSEEVSQNQIDSSNTADNYTSIPCLQLCQGQVKRLNVTSSPLPHMGWNQIFYKKQHPLFIKIPQASYFYFVHSYAMNLGDFTLASCEYEQEFSAVIEHENFYGVQFHPERSGKAGAQLIENFLSL